MAQMDADVASDEATGGHAGIAVHLHDHIPARHLPCFAGLWEPRPSPPDARIRHELVYRPDFLTDDEPSVPIFDSIARFHETRRLHSSTGHLAPADFEDTF